MEQAAKIPFLRCLPIPRTGPGACENLINSNALAAFRRKSNWAKN